jgi:hypothetical protein
VRLAGEQDTVIVTGKGHEPTQEIAGVFHRYNDRDVYLEVRSAGRQGSEPAAFPHVELLDVTGEPSLDDLVAGVRALRRTAVDRRTVAVVGAPSGAADVRDLDALGRLAVRLDVRRLAAVGDAVRAVHTGAYQEGSWDAESVHLPDVAAARAWLAAELRDGDVLLVAGAGAELANLAADLRQAVVQP